ncbi:MAG: tRNA lysidine(34) synthetase TilS [Thiobacillaceae bacterium]
MGSSRKPGQADLLERVRYALHGRVHDGTRLSVGLSGGLDSIVLLHLLHQLRSELGFTLLAVHVHHGLSPHADAWAEFCAAFCRALDVPLCIERVHVERDGSHGLEAAARQARYRVYAGLAVDFVVLAHQQDDQAETVLLNLLRGTGVAGMAAMPVERVLPDSSVRLLRPLLEVTRAQLEHYARRHGLTWVEDESNVDLSFARNHIRQAVLPVIGSRFPAYRGNLSRAARHFAECAELLAELARLDAKQAVGVAGLKLASLSRLPRARAKNLLRWYLGELGLRPWPEARLEAVLDQLLVAGPDNRVEIRAGDRSLRVWRGHLQVVAAVAGHTGMNVVWRGEESLSFAGGRLVFSRGVGEGISLARLGEEAVTLRTRSGGERLRPDCSRPRRTLKQLCQERAIPPWERDRLPLLYVGKELAWAAGLGTDCAWQAAKGEAGLLIAWHPGG